MYIWGIKPKKEYRHCDKKLVCLLFDFRVIQFMMLSTQTRQTMIVNYKF